ncbi:hypothetical protein LTR08_000093 [Meristemomyces frigidus]|nr:hypothetical protein LTR08_000093 [Meristemomyces frigidus]
MPDTSTSSNTAAVANQGEFHPSVGRDEPMQTGGHKPGVLTGNDAKPEFSAETLPAGSAPADRTFKPNPSAENTPVASNDGQVAANDMPGSTSGDVNAGLGKPI